MRRSLRIVVPFRLQGTKSRLSPVLSEEERRVLAQAMLEDVLAAVAGFGRVTVLSRPGLEPRDLGDGVEVTESELDLSGSLNALIEENSSLGWGSDILIVMADLALLTARDLYGILGTEGDVVLCPGRGGGTNMILIRDMRFRTCYRGCSFPRHLAFASQAGLRASIYESFRAGCDIDEPDDLLEVLLHSHGRARSALESMGFAVSGEECGRPLFRRGSDRLQ